MLPHLALKDKRKFFKCIGIQKMLLIEPDNNTLYGGFATCCGSHHLTETLKQLNRGTYGNRLYWEASLNDIPKSLPECAESLLIPDVQGNILVQWNDV